MHVQWHGLLAILAAVIVVMQFELVCAMQRIPYYEGDSSMKKNYGNNRPCEKTSGSRREQSTSCHCCLPTLPVFCLSFVKRDAQTGEVLPGAVFALSVNAQVIASAVSDDAGEVRICNIRAGSYMLAETVPPQGYAPNPMGYPVEIASDGEITISGRAMEDFSIENVRLRIPASFSPIVRSQATRLGLAGVSFSLRTPMGVTVATATSAADGALLFENIMPGVYSLLEVISPPGYLPILLVFTVVVSTDGVATINGMSANGFEIFGDPETQSISFAFGKRDQNTGMGLAGATFALVSQRSVRYSATSGANGIVSFSNIQAGRYTLIETSTLPGYRLNTRAHAVVASQNGTTIDGVVASRFIAENARVEPSNLRFSFAKVNGMTQTGLPGASYALSGNGVVLQTAQSDESGQVAFEGLSPGTYALRETQAPIGFAPDDTTYAVVISSGGAVTIGGTPSDLFVAENVPVA